MKERKIYIDVLKIIAIYMVLLIHTGEKGFMLFTVARGSSFYWVYMFNSIFIKIAVPLFFMSSGALLLGKEESIKDVLVHRFLKYLVVLIVASFFSYVYQCTRLEYPGFSSAYFFTVLYTNRMTNAYWYLYVYLSYILMLPFLRKIAKNLSDQEYIFMIWLYFGFRFLQILDFLIWKGALTHNGSFAYFIVDNYVFYPLLGYFIDSRIDKNIVHKFIYMLVLSFVSILVCCILTNYKCNLLDEWQEGTCQTFFETLSFIPAGTVFLGTKIWFSVHKISKKVGHIVSVLGGTSFGVFLFEQVWRNETKGIYEIVVPYVHSFLASIIWILCAVLLGVAVTYIVKGIGGTIIRNMRGYKLWESEK